MSTLKYRSSSSRDFVQSSHAIGVTTKGPTYDGSPQGFYEWKFRVELKAMSYELNLKKGDDPDVKTVSDIVDNLRGDALQVAMDLGTSELAKSGGIDKLIDEVRKIVFPVKKLEAKELYNQGHRPNGILTKQPNETMLSYISRRRRWWRLLKEMDPSIQLSEEIRGDLLLDHCGLSKDQQLMVLTSTQNVTTFETVAKALMEQHGKSRSSESTSTGGHDRSRGRKSFHR